MSHLKEIYMRIVMDGTHRGTNDGFGIRVYNKGEVYDSRSDGEYFISDTLAAAFIENKWAHVQTWKEWQDRINPLAFLNVINLKKA